MQKQQGDSRFACRRMVLFFGNVENHVVELNTFGLENLKHLVLHTFSKAWGLAAVRCGMAFASEEIIAYFNKVKYPYWFI